jgi:hypothetical protein
LSLLLLLLLLQEASVRGQLYMDTFQRLNLGLVLQAGTCLVVLAQAISLRNPLLSGEAGCMMIPAAMCLAVLCKDEGKSIMKCEQRSS